MGIGKKAVLFLVGWLLLSLASPSGAARVGHLVVVHRGGQTTVTAVRLDAANAAAEACGSDPTVVFAFTEEPLAGSGAQQVILRSAPPAQKKVDVNLTLTCSRFTSGSAQLTYSGSPGAGYAVTEGMATLNLASTTLSSATASLSVTITDLTRSDDITFQVTRTRGSFFGALTASPDQPVTGSIPGSSVPLVTATIRGPAVPPIGAVCPDPSNPVCSRPDDPQAAQIYTAVVTNFCGAHAAIPECIKLNDLASGVGSDPLKQQQLAAALRAIAPESTATIATSGTQVVTSQVGNVALRISTLLNGGGGGFSTGGLTLVGGGMPLSLSGLADVVNAADDSSGNEEKRTLLGGTRWGVWVNGNVGGGNHDRYQGNSGFDFDNYSLTSGLDYRFNDSFFLGGAVGYSRFTSDFDQRAGSLDADTLAIHGYGGYSLTPDLSLDGSVSWLHSSYDLVRIVPGVDIVSSTSRSTGSTDANQASASFGLTWSLRSEAWTFAPQAQYEFIRSDIDGFAERGTSAFLLDYADQHIVTRSLSAGLYVDFAKATGAGTFRPYTRVLFYSDGGTGSRNLLANFADGTAFNAVVVAEPDRTYGTVEFGTSFSHPIGTRTVDFNVGVMELFGFTALDRWAVRADVRIPF